MLARLGGNCWLVDFAELKLEEEVLVDDQQMSFFNRHTCDLTITNVGGLWSSCPTAEAAHLREVAKGVPITHQRDDHRQISNLRPPCF